MHVARFLSVSAGVTSRAIRRTVTTCSITETRLKISRCPPSVHAATSPNGRLLGISQSQTLSHFSRQLFTSRASKTHKMELHKTQPNGEAQHKRKNSPVSLQDRPAKVHKTDLLIRRENGDISHDEDFDMESESDDSRLPALAPAIADSVEWQATIEKVVRNVVSIHFCQTCSFDTDPAVSSEATGFVVDAERGYILTNRHVVGAGPFWGYCIFDNHEEVCRRLNLAGDLHY